MTKRDAAEVGGTRERRAREQSVESRKKEIARRLKLSERVLEQYFESKQAESEDELDPAVVPARPDHGAVREKHL